MRVGTPVVIIRDAGSGAFVGRRGIVVAAEPPYMVQLVGETRPLRFGSASLALASERLMRTVAE